MERQKRFAVIGSDARQLAAGRALARAGYAVEGPEEIALAAVSYTHLRAHET